MAKVARGVHTLGYTVGNRRRVRFDPAARTAVQRPGNLLTAGASGGGKSYSLKQLTARTVRRGGRVMVLSWLGQAGGDTWRDPYARLADVVPDSQVVTFGRQATHSVDPTRSSRSPETANRPTNLGERLPSLVPIPNLCLFHSVHMTAHHNTSNPSRPVFPALGVALTD